MKVAILGATRGMGRALARRFAERKADLVVLGRDTEGNNRSARDLEIRGGIAQVSTAACDLSDPATFAPALASAESAMGGLDTVIVTAGLFATQDRLEEDPDLAKIRGYVEDSGEGRWTVFEAINESVPAGVIALSLMARFASRQDESFAAKVNAALRNQFGGHAVKAAE